MLPARYSNILVRATNWLGDAVMSLPALRTIRCAFGDARITIVAKPWVADLYARERLADHILPYSARGFRDKMRFAFSLRQSGFDCAILLQNAFEAAAMASVARIPNIIGYNRDGRGFLMSQSIAVPKPGEIPPHERFYYLELLRRAGIIEGLPASDAIRLESAPEARTSGRALFAELGIREPAIGVSPGAAFGTAKQWLPERFAEAAADVAANRAASVVLFGSAAERALCDGVASAITARGVAVRNLAGETALAQFIDLAAACVVFLTNDSGAMHVASALGVPVVAVFGSTDENATAPASPLARIIKEPVECSPCLLRECPIDHRCMTGVPATRVTQAALDLLK